MVAYAKVALGDHPETLPLRSQAFRRWMIRIFYKQHQRTPSAQAVIDALGVLEGRALYDGKERRVFTRLGERKGSFYLDLGDPLWKAVRIDSDGWRIVTDPLIRFCRPRGMAPLPRPVRGGSLEELRQFVNVDSEQDWILLIAWLLGALYPHGPFPVLILHGEQGAAKSTTARVFRLLVDPNTAPLRSEPRDIRDLMIAAKNGWVVSFDNLSYLHGWLSDVICRLSTGGAFATRELYSDTEEVLFEAKRPVILNGIEEIATRGDLLDRAIIVELPQIPEDKRRDGRAFWREFEEAHPRILGALLDVISSAIRARPGIRLKAVPRMADFALWATAAERGLGWPEGTFLKAYTGNRASANSLALDASPSPRRCDPMQIKAGRGLRPISSIVSTCGSAGLRARKDGRSQRGLCPAPSRGSPRI